MKPATLALMAATMASLTDPRRMTYGTFSGGCRCKNCGSPTMSSEFCDLRCVCAYKEKQKAEVKP